jgi:hypothetical protein
MRGVDGSDELIIAGGRRLPLDRELRPDCPVSYLRCIATGAVRQVHDTVNGLC